MSVRRFPRNFACPFHLDRLVNAALIAFALVLLAAPARAEVKNVKIMMDWIIQGTHTPYLIAQEKGYFKAEGVTVDAIDRGMGATNVAVSVAGGAYQFGWVDLPTMIKFNAQNPGTPLLAVYVSFDETPMAVRCTTRSRSCSRPRAPRT